MKAEEAGGQDDGLRPGVEEDTDEELEERYANIEVNFDESETEEDDYVPRTIKLREMEKEVVEEQSEEEFPDEFLLYETREYEEVPVTVSRGKSFIQDDIDTASGNSRVTLTCICQDHHSPQHQHCRSERRGGEY